MKTTPFSAFIIVAHRMDRWAVPARGSFWANRNFVPLDEWTVAELTPINGPIGQYNWFLAVPHQWCVDNASSVEAIQNAADFPVIAWGPVLQRR